MAKVELKQPVVAEIAEVLNGAKSAVVVDYRGLTVEQDTALRKQLLFMLTDQFHVHCSHPPQAFLASSRAFSAAASASAHCSSLGWEEWSCLGSAKVAPLPLQVSSTMQLGTPFLA